MDARIERATSIDAMMKKKLLDWHTCNLGAPAQLGTQDKAKRAVTAADLPAEQTDHNRNQCQRHGKEYGSIESRIIPPSKYENHDDGHGGTK
jgi:hypothetical protein